MESSRKVGLGTDLEKNSEKVKREHIKYVSLLSSQQDQGNKNSVCSKRPDAH